MNAVRALPRKGRHLLNQRVVLKGYPVCAGFELYVDLRGAACLAFLAGLEDEELDAWTRAPLAFTEPIPEGAQEAYAAMAQGAGSATLLVHAERDASEDDLVASVTEAIQLAAKEDKPDGNVSGKRRRSNAG